MVVLAGTNGAGKSSVAGAFLRQREGEYFNPDEVAQRYLDTFPDLTVRQANGLAWNDGRRLLERAIERRLRFVFETTLGGNTITRLLLKAANVGLPVRVWYVGLETVELHVRRVRARASRGGHDIPEEKIRERFDASRKNLVRLLPHLAELKVLDNSREADPHEGLEPCPVVVLHLKGGRILESCPLQSVPPWAKPIVQAAIELID